MPPPDKDVKIACPTPQHLQAELDALSSTLALGEKEDTWEKLERALIRFASVTKGGGYKHVALYVEGIGRKGSGMEICACMMSDRGRLSGVATELLQTLAPRLANNFAPLVNLYLDPVMRLLGRPNKVVLKRSEKCLSTIISHCHLPAIILELKKGLSDDAATCRRGCAKGLERAMNEWVKEIWNEKGVRAMEEGIKKMATDKDPEVRQTGKRIWALYNELWPERVDDFSAPLSPVTRRYLDIASTNGPTKTKTQAPQRSMAPAQPHRPVSAASSASSSTTAPTAAHHPTKPTHARVNSTHGRPARIVEHEAGPSHHRPPVTTSSEPSSAPPSPPKREEKVRPVLSKSSTRSDFPQMGLPSRSVSHNPLPTMSSQASQAGPSSPQKAAEKNEKDLWGKPQRPQIATSLSTVSLPVDPSEHVRRFPPPSRVMRPLPSSNEERHQEHLFTPARPSTLGAAVRLANIQPQPQPDFKTLGHGRLGPAQRRIVTAPPLSSSVTEGTAPSTTITTSAISASQKAPRSVKKRVEELEEEIKSIGSPSSPVPVPAKSHFQHLSPSIKQPASPRFSPAVQSSPETQTHVSPLTRSLSTQFGANVPVDSPLLPVLMRSTNDNDGQQSEEREEDLRGVLEEMANMTVMDTTIVPLDSPAFAPESSDTAVMLERVETRREDEAVSVTVFAEDHQVAKEINLDEAVNVDFGFEEEEETKGIVPAPDVEDAAAPEPVTATAQAQKDQHVEVEEPLSSVKEEVRQEEKRAQPIFPRPEPTSSKQEEDRQEEIEPRPHELETAAEIDGPSHDLILDEPETSKPLPPASTPAALIPLPHSPIHSAVHLPEPEQAATAPAVIPPAPFPPERPPTKKLEAQNTGSTVRSQVTTTSNRAAARANQPRKPPVPTARSARVPSGPVVRKPFKPTTHSVSASTSKAALSSSTSTIATAPKKAEAVAASNGMSTQFADSSSTVAAPVRARAATTIPPKPPVPRVVSAKIATQPDIGKPVTRPAISASMTSFAASTMAAKAVLTKSQPVIAAATNHSTVTLPPVRKEKVRLKAPLPKFVPVRSKDRNATSATATAGAKTAAVTAPGRTKVVAKVKPESIPLPMSPAEKAQVPPKDIPLPRSRPVSPTEVSFSNKAARSSPGSIRASPFVTSSSNARALSPVLTTSLRSASPAPHRTPVPVNDNMKLVDAPSPEEIPSPFLQAANRHQINTDDLFSSSASRFSSTRTTAPPAELMESDSDDSDDEDPLNGITTKLGASAPGHTRKVIQPHVVQLKESEHDLMEFSASSRPAHGERKDVSTPNKAAEMLLAKLAGLNGTPKASPGPGGLERKALRARDTNRANGEGSGEEV